MALDQWGCGARAARAARVLLLLPARPPLSHQLTVHASLAQEKARAEVVAAARGGAGAVGAAAGAAAGAADVAAAAQQRQTVGAEARAQPQAVQRAPVPKPVAVPPRSHRRSAPATAPVTLCTFFSFIFGSKICVCEYVTRVR